MRPTSTPPRASQGCAGSRLSPSPSSCDRRVSTDTPILTGDFNAPHDADEVRCLVGKAAPPIRGFVLADAWAYARPLSPGWTWDRRNPHMAATFEPDARIDYVFAGPPGSDGRGQVLDVDLVGTERRDGVWPSDHFGVLALLRGGALERETNNHHEGADQEKTPRSPPE